MISSITVDISSVMSSGIGTRMRVCSGMDTFRDERDTTSMARMKVDILFWRDFLGDNARVVCFFVGCALVGVRAEEVGVGEIERD